MQRKTVVFDIDGTLADHRHRLHFIEGPVKDWKAFFDGMSNDGVFQPVCELLWMFYRSGTNVVFVTGRPERYRAVTKDWLARKLSIEVKDENLLMRHDGNRRSDVVIKTEALAALEARDMRPFLAIEDRERCVQMWRAHGVTCLQCADGKF